MKKKWNPKRLFSVSMASLVFTGVLLTSCSAGGNSSGSAENSTGTVNMDTESQGSGSSKVNVEGLPILTEPQSFTIAVSKSALCMNSYTEKEIVQQTEEITNIQFDWMEIPASGYTEKTNIMFASGDLPDAFLGGLGTDVISKNRNALVAVNTLLDEYGPSILEMFEERPDVQVSLTHPDGNIYSLPTGDEILNNLISGDIWVNTKWLERVGLEIPETTDEFMEMLIAFRDMDANGNGDPNDEIPFSACQSDNVGIGEGIDGLFGAFGTYDYPEHIVVQDGTVVFTPASENYYKALQWMSEMFAEGLMDPEIFTMNSEQFNSKFKSGDTIGCFTAFSPDMLVGGERMEEYTYIVPLKGPDGYQQWPMGTSINLGGFVITKQCANPEAMVRLYDYLTSDLTVALEWTYGKQNEHWEYVEGDKWRVMQENQPEGTSYGEWRQTLSAGPTAPVFMKMEWASDLKVLTTPRDLLKTEASEAYLPYTPDASDIPPEGFDDVERNDKRTLMQVEIDNYIKKFKSNSIMNGIDDAAWQAHLDTLESLKIDEYVQLWQEFYDAQNQ